MILVNFRGIIDSFTRIPLTSNTAFIIGHLNSPFITAWAFNTTNGFGSKFSQPATLPSTFLTTSTFDENGAVIWTTNNGVYAHAWSNTGFGTKYADPAIQPSGFQRGVHIHPSKNAVAVSSTTTGVSAYPWSSSTGFGTRYALPSPAFGNMGCRFFPNGNLIAVAHSASPYVGVYNWSSGFGSRYSNPSTLTTRTPSDAGNPIAVSPNNDAILFGLGYGTPAEVVGYAWNNGFSTKYSNAPNAPSAGTFYAIAFSPDNANVFASGSAQTYQWSSSTGFGTRYSTPSGGNNLDGARGTIWTSNFIAAQDTGDPGISVWQWNNGFGTKYSNPASTNGGAGRCLVYASV